MTDRSESEQLSYYVGEIVIHDSYAEHEARVFWGTLQAAGLTGPRRPEMFGRLLPELVDVLSHPVVPEIFRELATPLLDRARIWHRYRRDLVHDLLATGWGRSGHVYSALGKHPPRPLTDLRECGIELQRVGYGLRGLWVVAPYWVGGKQDSWTTADDLRSWTRVIMGHIEDAPGSIIGTRGESPEPPGGWDAIVAGLVEKREARDARRESMFIDLNKDDLLDDEEDD